MDLKRILTDKKFYFAVLLAFAAILIGTSWADLKPDAEAPAPFSCGTFLLTLEKALQSRTVLFLIPITAVLPCGDLYLREQQRHFLRFLLLRRTKKEYCRDRIFTTALSGAMVWLAAVFLGVLFFFLLLYSREALWNYPKETVLKLLCTVGRICLVSSALASLSACFGVLSGSVYLALGLPFILHSFGMILRERYLNGLYCIDPAEWIRAEQNWGSGGRSLWLFLLLLALSAALLHQMILEIRIGTEV